MDNLRVTLTPPQRRRLIAIAAVTATVFLTLGTMVHSDFVLAIDQGAQRFVQAERVPGFDRSMQVITRLGSGWVLLPLTGAVCLALTGWQRRLARIFVATALSAVILESVAKGLFGHDRPNTYAWGYPSAHVLGLVAFFGMGVYTLWMLGARARWCALASVIGGILVAAVGFSRLWVNAHWLSDVVGGVTGGTALVLTIVITLDVRARLRSDRDAAEPADPASLTAR